MLAHGRVSRLAGQDTRALLSRVSAFGVARGHGNHPVRCSLLPPEIQNRSGLSQGAHLPAFRRSGLRLPRLFQRQGDRHAHRRLHSLLLRCHRCGQRGRQHPATRRHRPFRHFLSFARQTARQTRRNMVHAAVRNMADGVDGKRARDLSQGYDRHPRHRS